MKRALNQSADCAYHGWCSFFKNVDTRSEPGLYLPVGTGQGPVHSLKVRPHLHFMPRRLQTLVPERTTAR